jgi:DNA-binding response OmpR family regulator
MNNELNKKTILVVEDEKPLLEAVRIKLEKGGFSVVTARTAEQAYNLLEDIHKIDVLWLDHYLIGKENGLDIVVKIKEQDEYKNIPIFIVSNTASADKVKSYINLGVNKYYIKSNYRLDSIIKDISDSLK